MTTPLSLGSEIATYLQGFTPSLGLNFSNPGAINLFVAGLPDDTTTPDLAASVMERGGISPIMTLTGGDQALVNKLDRPQVQIRVRAAMGGYIAGNTLVNGIMGALQGKANTILNSGGATFTLLMATQSPVYLGRDERERHGWTLNIWSWWENPQRGSGSV